MAGADNNVAEVRKSWFETTMIDDVRKLFANDPIKEAIKSAVQLDPNRESIF